MYSCTLYVFIIIRLISYVMSVCNFKQLKFTSIPLGGSTNIMLNTVKHEYNKYTEKFPYTCLYLPLAFLRDHHTYLLEHAQ